MPLADAFGISNQMLGSSTMFIDKKIFWQRTYRFLIVWGILAIVYSLELIIESYPEFPKDLRLWLFIVFFCPLLWLILNLTFEYFFGKRIRNGFNRIGEKRLRTINKVLVGIIIVPIVVLLFIGLVISFFKR